MSESRIYDLITEAERDAIVATALKDALRALQLIHLAGVVVSGEVGILDFSIEIEKLKAALHLMGVEEDVTEDAGGGASRSSGHPGLSARFLALNVHSQDVPVIEKRKVFVL